MKNNLKIDRTEVMKLYESCISSLSVHSIGQWLKSKTDGKFVIIPKEHEIFLFAYLKDTQQKTFLKH